MQALNELELNTVSGGLKEAQVTYIVGAAAQALTMFAAQKYYTDKGLSADSLGPKYLLLPSLQLMALGLSNEVTNFVFSFFETPETPCK